MKQLLLIATAFLLTGCVIEHRKSAPSPFLPHTKMADIGAFSGTYQNRAIDWDTRRQSTLAEYEFGYWQPGIKEIDLISITISEQADLSIIGLSAGKEEFRNTYTKDRYSFNGRAISLGSSSHSTSPDTMMAGTESEKSSISLTATGALVYRTKRGFRGLAYGLVPASTSQERISIFEKTQ